MKTTRVSRSSFIHSGLLIALVLPAMSAQMTDFFDDRPRITAASAEMLADTTNATTEPGELPYTHPLQRDNTVWAEWIAPGNGWVVIDTLGTSFRKPMIAVFRDCNFPPAGEASAHGFLIPAFVIGWADLRIARVLYGRPLRFEFGGARQPPRFPQARNHPVSGRG